MRPESSDRPVVELLRKVLRYMADDGVTFAPKASLSPDDNVKLVDPISKGQSVFSRLRL